ncbi:MAG: hypothetical protein DA328_03525 [Nitrososphaeraceae archaeon]|nr:hypothetical protein [Nitrososphaeraceae archaeon]
MSSDKFIDERLLVSRDALNQFLIKIKLLEIDESARDYSPRFGKRVLAKKILLILKHLQSEEIEDIELDIEEIEQRIRKERLFSSSNRWIASNELKNGYVVASKHLDLLSDAISLDIISF